MRLICRVLNFAIKVQTKLLNFAKVTMAMANVSFAKILNLPIRQSFVQYGMLATALLECIDLIYSCKITGFVVAVGKLENHLPGH